MTWIEKVHQKLNLFCGTFSSTICCVCIRFRTNLGKNRSTKKYQKIHVSIFEIMRSARMVSYYSSEFWLFWIFRIFQKIECRKFDKMWKTKGHSCAFLDHNLCTFILVCGLEFVRYIHTHFWNQIYVHSCTFLDENAFFDIFSIILIFEF